MYATVTVSITVNTAEDVDVVARILRAGLGSATEIRVEPAAAEPAAAPVQEPPAAAAAPVATPAAAAPKKAKKAAPAPAEAAPTAAAEAPAAAPELVPPVKLEVPAAPAKPAPALNQLSLDDVKAAVRERIEATGIEDVRRIFAAHGGAKLSDFGPEAYWSLVTDLKEAK
ncbi:MAG: hypothetical protein RLZZ246_2010 [Planctomycetota bacterium]|jgi:hypothetical protein